MPTELAEHLIDPSGGEIAPAVLREEVAGQIPMQPARAAAAMLELHGPAHITAVDRADRGAGVGAAILGLNRERAAQRVEAEQRIRTRHQRGRSDRHARNEIPAHHIAKRLIQPHAIHVDRQTLRRPEQWGRRVAAIVHIRLKRIPLHLVDEHAIEASIEKIRQVQRAARVDVRAAGRLDGSGNLLEPEVQPRKRRRLDDFDLERGRAGWRRVLRCLGSLRVLGTRNRRRGEHRPENDRSQAPCQT